MSNWHLLKSQLQRNAFAISKRDRKNLNDVMFMRLRDKYKSKLKLVALRKSVERKSMVLVAQYAFEEHYEYDNEQSLLSDISEINRRYVELVFSNDDIMVKRERPKKVPRNETSDQRRRRLKMQKEEKLRRFLFSKPSSNVKITYNNEQP